jgi:hypothetical protein
MGYITGLGFPFLLVLLRYYPICICPRFTFFSILHLSEHCYIPTFSIHGMGYMEFLLLIWTANGHSSGFCDTIPGWKIGARDGYSRMDRFCLLLLFSPGFIIHFPLSFPAHQHCTIRHGKFCPRLDWTDGWYGSGLFAMLWFWIFLRLCCDSALFEWRWCLR